MESKQKGGHCMLTTNEKNLQGQMDDAEEMAAVVKEVKERENKIRLLGVLEGYKLATGVDLKVV